MNLLPHEYAIMKKEEKELQTVTDLVAFQVMTKILLHRQNVEQIHEFANHEFVPTQEDEFAGHASDSFETVAAGHQSDSDLPKNSWGLSLPTAWKISRLWHFYKRWIS